MTPRNTAASAEVGLVFLTREQSRALGAVALAGSQAGAGRLLGKSSRTVAAQLTAAYEALDVQNITDAYRRLGWLDVPTELLDLEPPEPDSALIWLGV